MTQPASENASQIQLHQLLRAMIEKGASDLHITTGQSPLLRIDGAIVPLKLPKLEPVDTKRLCYTILTEEQKIQFEQNNELDFAFGVRGLSRFRANIFMQRDNVAGAFRTIPFKILTFEELGLPGIVPDLANKPSGLVLVTGTDGQRQVDDARFDDRQDQQRAAPAHHHDRRSDRVSCTRTSSRSSISAKSAPTRRASKSR